MAAMARLYLDIATEAMTEHGMTLWLGA